MGLRGDIESDLLAHGYDDTDEATMLKAWFFHPSLRLLINYRLIRLLPETNVFARFARRWLWANIVSFTACHISPHCVIEPGVNFPHATGIVIGNGAHVHRGVRIFQHVTIANKDEGDKAAVILRGAVLYTGCIVIGNVTIGEGVVIPAHAVIKGDVVPAQAAPILSAVRR